MTESNKLTLLLAVLETHTAAMAVIPSTVIVRTNLAVFVSESASSFGRMSASKDICWLS